MTLYCWPDYQTSFKSPFGSNGCFQMQKWKTLFQKLRVEMVKLLWKGEKDCRSKNSVFRENRCPPWPRKKNFQFFYGWTIKK